MYYIKEINYSNVRYCVECHDEMLDIAITIEGVCDAETMAHIPETSPIYRAVRKLVDKLYSMCPDCQMHVPF